MLPWRQCDNRAEPHPPHDYPNWFSEVLRWHCLGWAAGETKADVIQRAADQYGWTSYTAPGQLAPGQMETVVFRRGGREVLVTFDRRGAVVVGATSSGRTAGERGPHTWVLNWLSED